MYQRGILARATLRYIPVGLSVEQKLGCSTVAPPPPREICDTSFEFNDAGHDRNCYNRLGMR